MVRLKIENKILKKERKEILNKNLSEIQRLAVKNYLKGIMSLESLSEVINFSQLRAKFNSQGITFSDLY